MSQTFLLKKNKVCQTLFEERLPSSNERQLTRSLRQDPALSLRSAAEKTFMFY